MGKADNWKEAARDAIYADITSERERQDEVHGGLTHDQTHTVSDWTRFIHDYADKANEAARNGDLQQARTRLVEIAALAVAGLEVLDKIDAYSSEQH